MKFFRKCLKVLLVLLASLVLVASGVVLSFRYAPAFGVVSINGCYLGNGYTVTKCERQENEKYVIYKVLGVRGKDVLVVEHAIPKGQRYGSLNL